MALSSSPPGPASGLYYQHTGISTAGPPRDCPPCAGDLKGPGWHGVWAPCCSPSPGQGQSRTPSSRKAQCQETVLAALQHQQAVGTGNSHIHTGSSPVPCDADTISGSLSQDVGDSTWGPTAQSTDLRGRLHGGEPHTGGPHTGFLQRGGVRQHLAMNSVILLPQCSGCKDYRPAPPHLAL